MEKFLFITVIALCGTLASSYNVQGANRIVNGQLATNQFRYAISLQKISEAAVDTRGHRCGGALITLQHALTAASCNFDVINGSFVAINPAEYRVFSGNANLTQDTSINLSRRITNITVHPEYYTSTQYRNDIAVIFLVQPFFSTTITPILLPTSEVDPIALAPCNVAGWGAQNDKDLASVRMMQFYKRVSLQGHCVSHFYGQITILETMMCASGVMQTEFSGCTGDIGNPLVCSGYVHGILIRNKECVVSADPEVYTRVFRYSAWINNLIGNRPTPSGASTFQPVLAVLTVIAFAHIVINNVSS